MHFNYFVKLSIINRETKLFKKNDLPLSTPCKLQVLPNQAIWRRTYTFIFYNNLSFVDNAFSDMRPHLFKNILLTGGNAMFPGYKERVESDVRSMAPALYEVSVTKPDQ